MFGAKLNPLIDKLANKGLIIRKLVGKTPASGQVTGWEQANKKKQASEELGSIRLRSGLS